MRPSALPLIALVTFAAAGAGAEPDPQDQARRLRRALLELDTREPALEDVRDAALRHAGLSGRPERGWSRRARTAALLPTLTLRTTVGRAYDEDLTRQSTGTERLKIAVDDSRGYEARAVWKLDRLVFDGAEIRAAQTAQRLHTARLQVATQVNTVFYRRRKLQLEALLDDGTDPVSAARRQLEIEELTGQLDALSDGYFSRYTRQPFDPANEPDR